MLNTKFMIRMMTVSDIEQVMIIENDSFSLPWSRDSYMNEFNNKFASYVICDVRGQVAGYAGIWVVFEEAHVTNVAVSRNYRQAGIGEALMEELERIARNKKATRILLEVRPSNNPALAMYRKMGFLATGLRKKYYSDNDEDAIVMTKFLF
ncbi:MAG: ribosomal protein S18-alanine N-acetyltransferase [Syntrophomonas sp.]